MKRLLCALVVVCIGFASWETPCLGGWGTSAAVSAAHDPLTCPKCQNTASGLLRDVRRDYQRAFPGQSPQSPRAAGRNTCEKPHPAVARIWIRGKGTTEKSVGTAVLIFKRGKRAVAITAQHLFRKVRKPVEVILEFPDGERFQAAVVAEDVPADLAAVVLAAPSAEPVSIYLDDPKPGERVTVAGYGSDGCYRTTAGTVQGYRRGPDNKAHWLVMTGGSRGGDSGGPMLNASGELVGVLWGTDGQTSMGAYNGRICQFLETERYVLPWNADLAAEKERSRQQIVPVQPQFIQPQVLPGPAIDSEARQMARDALSRVAALEQSVTASIAGASSAASQATAKAEEATVVADATAAGLAVWKEGLTDEVVDATGAAVKPLLIKWAAGLGVTGMLPLAGIGIAVFFLGGRIKKDRAEYLAGKDPSMLQSAAARTPWGWDDVIADKITERLYGKQQAPPGPQQPAPPAQPAPPDPVAEVQKLKEQVAELRGQLKQPAPTIPPAVTV